MNKFNPITIFIVVYLAMIATSFWESYVEGRNPWDKHKLGWKIQITKKFCLPAYHFYLFFVTFPLLLSLPLVIYGWNSKLFGLLLSAYLTGIVVEDFMWYVVNPKVKLKEFNSNFADFYPWLKFGRFEIPLNYITSIFFSFLSWYFLWR